MDNYIAKRRETIKKLQTTILIKFSFSLLLLLSIPVWVAAINAQPAPDEWLSTETVCTALSVNEEAKNPYAVIGAEDGFNYLADPAVISPELVLEKLEEGDILSLRYSEAGSNRIARAIAAGGETVLDEADSVAAWKTDRVRSYAVIAIIIAAAAGSAILIDRIWCKGDKAQIRELKAEIARREEKVRGKSEKN